MVLRTFVFITLLTMLGAIGIFAQKPSPSPPPAPFLMEIDDVFYIAGAGTVATGKIERGKVKPGDTVELVGIRAPVQTTVVRIDAFGRPLTEAETGANVGLLLRGLQKTDVTRGQLLIKPGSVTTYTKFKATIDLIEAKDGGRRTPVPSGFRPQVFFRTVGFSGTLLLSEGKQSAAAGEKGIAVEIELTEPAAFESGGTFTLRDGGRTIASGKITGVVPKK